MLYCSKWEKTNIDDLVPRPNFFFICAATTTRKNRNSSLHTFKDKRDIT